MECSSEVEGGIACKNKCEDSVKLLGDLVQRGKSAYKKTDGSYFANGIFIILLGLVFFIIAVLRNTCGYFEYSMGSIFVLWGIVSLITSRGYLNKN